MSITLEESYRHCVAASRTAARNFYYGFRLLPRDKHRAICAVYAFMRLADDAADDASNHGAEAIQRWSAALDAAYSQDETISTSSPILPAFRDTARRYELRKEWFLELMEGVRTDLGPVRFASVAELDRYCYRVAGVVGLVCLRIWGVTDYDRADPLAIDCGAAFQLTNILRDLKEDAQRGRLYLPQSDLMRHQVHEEDILGSRPSDRVVDLIADEADRAEGLYKRSAPLARMISPDSRPTFLAMFMIYRGLLALIRRDPAAVLQRRVSLHPLRKIALASRAVMLARLHSTA